jgi:hypothetical protein
MKVMYERGKKTYKTMEAAVLPAKENGEWLGDVPTVAFIMVGAAIILLHKMQAV